MKGAVLTNDEKAFLIATHLPAHMAFLIESNPGKMNDLLRHELGFETLPYTPDHAAMARILTMLIEKNDTAKLNYILNNFTFKPDHVIDADFQNKILQHAGANAKSAKLYYIGKDGVKYEKTF